MLPIPRAATPRNTLRAELSGSSHSTAAGVTASGYMPILAICRALVRDGIDPTTPMECYRGDTLALRVRSVGEAANLDLNSKGTGFVRCRQAVRIAPPGGGRLAEALS